MPLAEKLEAKGIPFIFATGYGASGIDAKFKDRPVLTKPFRDADLTSALKAVTERLRRCFTSGCGARVRGLLRLIKSQASTSLRSHTTHRGESAKRRGNSPRCSISQMVLSARGTISCSCCHRIVRLRPLISWRAIIDLLLHFSAVEFDSYRMNRGISP